MDVLAPQRLQLPLCLAHRNLSIPRSLFPVCASLQPWLEYLESLALLPFDSLTP